MIPAKNRSCLSWSPRHSPQRQRHPHTACHELKVFRADSDSDNFPRGCRQTDPRNTLITLPSQRVSNHKSKPTKPYQPHRVFLKEKFCLTSFSPAFSTHSGPPFHRTPVSICTMHSAKWWSIVLSRVRAACQIHKSAPSKGCE